MEFKSELLMNMSTLTQGDYLMRMGLFFIAAYASALSYGILTLWTYVYNNLIF